ncbi:hypothetical protein [Halorussus sp. GCM10023401]|uniref:hypothetical protein n=1 Tax=Halorussus sp. GCM10023401 TaxID=3252680 RepID=UPI00361E5F73
MVGAGAGLSAGGTGLTSLGVQSVRAQQESPCNTVDGFEDGDLSEYEFDRGSSGASVVSSPTYTGSHALEISGTNTEMISMDGLEHYPAAGDVFSTWVRGTNNADRINITYGVQNHTNRYFARVNPEQGHVALYRTEDGSSTLLTDKSVPLSQDTWYEVHIDWQTDGTHVFTLFDDSGSQISQISATDSTWTAGGIGYDAYLGDGGTVYIDHTQIHSGREIVSANEVIDSFEDSDLAEYSFDRGSSGASVVSNPTYGGSSVLEISNDNTEMISTSGLDHYPSAGDVFSTWVRGTGGADDINFMYGVQDHTNRYFVRVDFANDNLKLYRYENASATLLEKQTSGFTLSEDTWYNVEVDWRKTGAHTVTLYDCDGGQVAQITGTDSTWTSGGIGYDAYLGSSGGTVYFDYVAIHSSVLDDFEDGDLSEYSGDTGSFTVQNSTVLEGNQTLKGTSAGSAIARADTKTPRGNRYEVSVMVGSGSGAKPALLTCVQDVSSPLADCYYLVADSVNEKLALYRREGGSDVLLDRESVTINAGTEYRLGIELEEDLILGSITDSSGTELAGVADIDTTYSNGRLGLSLLGGSPAYFDHVQSEPIWVDQLDDFEDGDISEYSGDTAYYTAQSSTVLTGNYTLEGTDNYRGIAHQTASSTRGRTYRCRVMAGTNSGSRPGLLTCVQDSNEPIANCYWAQANSEYNELKLYRRENGESYLLDKTDVTIAEGTEYRLAIVLNDVKIQANLYSETGKLLANTASVEDRTFESGTIGFYTGGSGGSAYYDSVTAHPIETKYGTKDSTTTAEANDALDTTVAQTVLSELNNPTTDPSNATRSNVYGSQERLEGYLITIPIEYGELIVEYNGETAQDANAKLDRSTMPSSLISDLSDEFGWPSSEDGRLFYDRNMSEPLFLRSATDSEETDLTNLVNSYDDRDDEPHGITVKNNNGGKYRVVYNDKKYEVNEQIDTVTSDSSLYGSPSCDSLKDQCNAQETWTGISLGYTALTCTVAIAEPTIAGEIVCIHALTAEFAANTATAIGGACKRYQEKCK